MFSSSEHGPIRCYLASHFASHFTIKIIATVLLLGLINSFFDVNRSAVIEAPVPQAYHAQQLLVILILSHAGTVISHVHALLYQTLQRPYKVDAIIIIILIIISPFCIEEMEA